METTSFIPNFPKRGMPVTIITGFLGSGKTTLLNQILENKQDLKVAVLVNEFGDINIDAQLLISTDDDMVELSNGCICCTINEGLVDAVYRVLEREEQMDYMVIETTGVADPLPIILTFLGTELRELTRLDSVIGMVDAESFTPDHFDSEAALKQITFSDVVILNKTDLASVSKIEELERYIGVVKTSARILKSQYGQVPLPLILDVGLTPIEQYQDEEEEHHPHEHHEHHHHDHSEHSDTEEKHHHHEHHEHHHAEHLDGEEKHHHYEHHHHEHHEHHHHHSDHLDNDGFISMSFQSERPFDLDKFEIFLTEEMPTTVFRAKGILWFNQSEKRHIFQLSGPRYDIKVEDWLETPKNQVVFIGRHLDTDKMRQQLTDCLVSNEAELAAIPRVSSL
jgi:G3E family GTPase